MRMMDSKYLKGGPEIFQDYPHLSGSTVNSIFDRIEQKKDGSFVISGEHPQFYAINIEDGRKPVWSNPKKSYCQTGQSPVENSCVAWNGDSEYGISLYAPGPNKHIGNVQEIYWDAEISKHDKRSSPLVWLVILFLVITLLKKGKN